MAVTSSGADPPEPVSPAFHPLLSIRELAFSVLKRVRGWSCEARVLATAWAVFLALTIFLSYQRYLTYQTNTWDLGINMQALWTTAYQGRFLYYTAELSWNSSGSLMGVELTTFLLALAPLYRVVPGALTLFVVQSAAVCASSLPLYLLAVRRTTRRASLCIALAYLFSAPLLGGLFYDFHSEAFVPLFGLTVWYGWETRKPRLLAISAVALLSVIEFTPLILGAIALMFLLEGLWSWKVKHSSVDRTYLRWMVFLPLVVLALCAVLTPIWFTIPKLISPSTPPIHQAGVLGGNLSQILVNVLNPTLVAQALSVHRSSKLIYLEVMLLAGLVLWVLRPRQVLPALPWIAVMLLASTTGYDVAAGNQYTFLDFPFLLPATASGYALVRRRLDGLRAARSVLPVPPTAAQLRSRWRRRSQLGRQSALTIALVGGLVLGFGVSQVDWSPLSPYSMNWEKVYEVPSAHTHLLDQAARLVPPTASIAAEPDLFPQFADRGDAYPYVVPGVDFIFYDTTSWWYTAILPPPATNLPWSDEVRNVSGHYGVLVSSDGVMLLEAGYVGIPQIFTPINESLNANSFSLRNATLVQDPDSPLGGYLVPAMVTDTRLWYGPYAFVTPGEYSLDFWLRDSGSARGPLDLSVTIDLGVVNLENVSFSAGQLGENWTLVHSTIAVGWPTHLEISGTSGPQPSGIEFGGALLSETRIPSQVE